MKIRLKDVESELEEMKVQNRNLTSNAEVYLKKIKDLEAWETAHESYD